MALQHRGDAVGNRQGITLLDITNFLHLPDDGFNSDEKRYDWQMDLRANYILIGDVEPNIPIYRYSHGNDKMMKSDIKWINKGELVAGSFMCNLTGSFESTKVHNDIDIYFKCKEDAALFLEANKDLRSIDACDVAYTVRRGNDILNLIFGIHYASPDNLITRFDIRACSTAYDPSNNTIFSVVGALQDCLMRRIVYNPIPHNTTVARLVKYTQKGFHIDPYQRLFLVELLKSSKYNPKLEISTGYRAITHEDI